MPSRAEVASKISFLADQAALELAVMLARRSVRRREFEALQRRYGWRRAAEIASYDAQCRSLNLAPWQAPPCAAGRGDKGPAGHLWRRMRRRGISRWHPRPLEAIEAAGKGITVAVLASFLVVGPLMSTAAHNDQSAREACTFAG
jgi:hypothetical protein